MGSYRAERQRNRHESQAPQLLSGAGTIDISKPGTKFTSTGAGQALVMPNGKTIGQRHWIIHIVDGGSGVLTGTFSPAITSFTFTTVRAGILLEWTATGWIFLSITGTVTTDWAIA